MGSKYPWPKVFQEFIFTRTSQGIRIDADLHMCLHHQMQMDKELKGAVELPRSPNIKKAQFIIDLLNSSLCGGTISGGVSYSVYIRFQVNPALTLYCSAVLQRRYGRWVGSVLPSGSSVSEARPPCDLHECDFREQRGHSAPVVCNRRRGKGGVPGKMSQMQRWQYSRLFVIEVRQASST